MEEKKLWYVKEHPCFPACVKGYTVAKTRWNAAWNVGWRNGLRGDYLDNFAGNAEVLTAKEVKNQPPEKTQESLTAEELIQSLEVLNKLGIDSPEILEKIRLEMEKLLQKELEEEGGSGQFIFHFYSFKK